MSVKVMSGLFAINYTIFGFIFFCVFPSTSKIVFAKVKDNGNYTYIFSLILMNILYFSAKSMIDKKLLKNLHSHFKLTLCDKNKKDSLV